MQEDIYFAANNMGDAYLPRQIELPFFAQECIALLVPMEDNSRTCVNAHKTFFKKLGMSEEQIEQVMRGIDNIECEGRERLLLKFSLSASRKDCYKILKSDMDAARNAGYGDTQIFQALAITSYFNYINTISNVFGLDDEE